MVADNVDTIFSPSVFLIQRHDEEFFNRWMFDAYLAQAI